MGFAGKEGADTSFGLATLIPTNPERTLIPSRVFDKLMAGR